MPDRLLNLYDRAAGLAPFGAWSCDLQTDELTWTAGVFSLFGLTPGTPVEREAILEMYTDESREALEKRRGHAIATGSGFTLDANIVGLDGIDRWIRITAAAQVANGRTVALYGKKQDITEDHWRWETLRRRAETDALTGVANRGRFHSDFLGHLPSSPALEGIGALVLFDMDGFKSINDRWGHAAGDTCLSTFARRLQVSFANAPLIARVGGDEFAVLLPPTSSRPLTEAKVRDKVARLHAPTKWGDASLPLCVSAGLAFAEPARGFDPQELFVAADRALYAAKRDPLAALHVARGRLGN